MFSTAVKALMSLGLVPSTVVVMGYIETGSEMVEIKCVAVILAQGVPCSVLHVPMEERLACVYTLL